MTTFRNILSRTMNEKGINQAWLSEKTGLPRGTISRLLNGVHAPASDTVCQIADALNVSTDFLLGRTAIASPETAANEKAMLLYRAYTKCTRRDRGIIDTILLDYLDDIDRSHFQKKG